MKSSSSSRLLSSSCSNGVWQRLCCCNMLDMSSTLNSSRGLSASRPLSLAPAVPRPLSSSLISQVFFSGPIWTQIWLSDSLYFVFNYFLEAIIWQRTFVHRSHWVMLTKIMWVFFGSRDNGLFGMKRKNKVGHLLQTCTLAELIKEQFQPQRPKNVPCVCLVWHYLSQLI